MCKIIVNCAVALDLNLIAENNISNNTDWKRVDKLRSSVDAIIIGAETARSDMPKLTIKDESLISTRLAHGLPSQLTRIVITKSGDFKEGFLEPLVGIRTIVVGIGEECEIKTPFAVEIRKLATLAELPWLLKKEGFTKVLVEGGAILINSLLEANLVDELHLAIAPFADDGEKLKLFFPELKRERMTFFETSICDDMAIISLKRR